MLVIKLPMLLLAETLPNLSTFILSMFGQEVLLDAQGFQNRARINKIFAQTHSGFL
jgi:hypothetical protein